MTEKDKMGKKISLVVFTILSGLSMYAQTLEKMNFYSFDDKEYHMMRNAWVEANHPVKIGMFAACPDDNGFKASFSDFKVTHLPDKIRSEWLEKNTANDK